MADLHPNPHPAFLYMWMLEKAIAEDDRGRVRTALRGLSKRGFNVRIVPPQVKSMPAVATGELRTTDRERQGRANLP